MGHRTFEPKITGFRCVIAGFGWDIAPFSRKFQVLAALSNLLAAFSQPEGGMLYPQMKNLII